MALLLIFAFVSGLVTILAPCIWPLLPVVLSSTMAGKGKKRPLGISLGIALSFGVFTLALSSLVRAFHFDPNLLRIVAAVILLLLGMTMIVPRFSVILESSISRLNGRFGQPKTSSRSGFLGGLVTGISLGIIWSPCAGPVLAAIATLAATGMVSFGIILVTLAYTLGISIPLFIFASAGQKVLLRSRLLNPFTGRIQQLFGLIMLLTALAIYTGYDKTLELELLNALPTLNQATIGFETNPLVTDRLNALLHRTSLGGRSGLKDLGPAPDFQGGVKWLNTSRPLTLSSLRGKVVLVDFWTYTCINCIRTLPFVTSWYDKYKNRGLVVIGVHTPEFEFEKNTSNVEGAIKRFNIHYPVVQDNNYTIWNAYSNEYWPAEYLIDAKGELREAHFGEGDYDQTEEHIQQLLKEAGYQTSAGLVNMTDQTPDTALSPETYLGSERMEYYFPDGHLDPETKNFVPAGDLPVNRFTLDGQWNISTDHATAFVSSTLKYNFNADKVFLVISPSGQMPGGDKIRLLLDGKPLDLSNSGADVLNSEITVTSDRLYNLINLKNHLGNHLLELQFEDLGTQVFAFTFG